MGMKENQTIRPCLVALGPFGCHIQMTVPLPLQNGGAEWLFSNGE